MSAIVRLPLLDRLAALAIATLMVGSLAVAAEAHAFCSIFCIHGDRMIGSDICSGQN